MALQHNTYDDYAEAYAALLAKWESGSFSLYHHLVVPQVLHFLGDVAGRTVLDAGCGEGYLARLLANRGAHVTAVDISPQLVAMAQAQDPTGEITYGVQDLSKGLSHDRPLFDLVVSNLVLNDVYDYMGYITTLGVVTKPGSRVVVSMNNPYSAVIRGKAQSYFESGAAILYQGLSASGVRVYHFHRTLEEYITAFREAGFLLRSLADVRQTDDWPVNANPNPQQEIVPFIIILELVKSRE
jgi:2-polyprenyl-3-methyl-5-hydroxy-6-metoxy-1,4-benzoquinol methylase